MNHVHCTLYLTKHNLWVVSPKDTSRALFEKQWDGTDSTEIFEQLVQSVGITHLTVVLGHDMSYVCIVPHVEPSHEDDIWNRIQEYIPVDVSDRSNASWHEIHDPGSSSTHIQVLAADRVYLQMIASAALQTGIHVQAVTAIGLLLGRYISGATPQMLLWESLERLAVTAVSGNVYRVTALSTQIQPAFFLSQRMYAQSMWEIVPATVVIDQRSSPETVSQVPKEYTVQQLTIDPFLYDPERAADPWKTVVVLPKFTQKKQSLPASPAHTDAPRTGGKHPSMLILLGSLVIVLLLIALWFVYNFRY